MPTPSTAILTAAAVVGGRLHEYATDADIQDVIGRYGHAVSVTRQEDAAGVRYVVECPTRRGVGAALLQTIAHAQHVRIHVI